MHRWSSKIVWVLAVLALLGACQSSAPERKTVRVPVGAVTAPAKPPSIVWRYTNVSQNRTTGYNRVTIAPDGTRTTEFRHHNNGRGPEYKTVLRVGPDGTLEKFDATGHDEDNLPVDEHFSLAQGRARWQSTAERGEVVPSAGAFYAPLYAGPEVLALMAAALERAGGTLPLLPAGEARLERGGELTVRLGAEQRHLRSVEIIGLDLIPTRLWLDDDGTFFGAFDPWFSCVREGWEKAIDQVIAEQLRLNAERDRILADKLGHKPPAAGLAFTHARVFDAEHKKWLDDQTVLVQNDKISTVGPSKRAKVPAGAETIDAAGKALLPGLWDVHAHLGRADGVLNIASGVTTVRDVGSDPDELDDTKRRFDGLTAIGPHVLRSGMVEGRGEDALGSKVTATTEAEAAAAVEEFARRGYEGLKIYNSVKPELVPVLTKLAHAKGMRVNGHIPMGLRAEDAVKAGYDEITHVNMVFLNFLAGKDVDTRTLARFTIVAEQGADFDLAGEPMKRFVALLRDRRTTFDPTLATFEHYFTARPGKMPPGFAAMVPRLPVQTQRWFFTGGILVPPGKDQRYDDAFKAMVKMVRVLHDAGVPVLPGTDHIAGLALYRELELYVEAGIPSAEVLYMATLGAARALGRDQTTGSIAAGKMADLVLVDGNPIARIADIERPTAVVRGGVLFKPAELYPTVGVKPPPPR